MPVWNDRNGPYARVIIGRRRHTIRARSAASAARCRSAGRDRRRDPCPDTTTQQPVRLLLQLEHEGVLVVNPPQARAQA